MSYVNEKCKRFQLANDSCLPGPPVAVDATPKHTWANITNEGTFSVFEDRLHPAHCSSVHVRVEVSNDKVLL
jgi:hypothetical protein